MDDVCALHDRYGLRLDTEVAYRVKVHATFADVHRATALGCFTVLDDGRVAVPPVRVEPRFLNSEPFRLRLLLNALTTPHVLLGGARRTYLEHRSRAAVSLALLALSIRDERIVRRTDLILALVTAADGASGEDFLGYGDVEHLGEVLDRGLTALAKEGVVRTDSEVVVQSCARRRSAVLARLS